MWFFYTHVLHSRTYVRTYQEERDASSCSVGGVHVAGIAGAVEQPLCVIAVLEE